jgi:hypothetical protein
MSLFAVLACSTLLPIVVVIGAVLGAVEGYEDETGFHVVPASSHPRSRWTGWFDDAGRDDLFAGEIVSLADELARNEVRTHFPGAKASRG